MGPLRMTAEEVDGEVELQIDDATEPHDGDEVVERDGARVFLDAARRRGARRPGDRRARPRRPLPLHVRGPAGLSSASRERRLRRRMPLNSSVERDHALPEGGAGRARPVARCPRVRVPRRRDRRARTASSGSTGSRETQWPAARWYGSNVAAGSRYANIARALQVGRASSCSIACTRLRAVAVEESRRRRRRSSSSTAQKVPRGQSRGNQYAGTCSSSIAHTSGSGESCAATARGSKRTIAGSSLTCHRTVTITYRTTPHLGRVVARPLGWQPPNRPAHRSGTKVELRPTHAPAVARRLYRGPRPTQPAAAVKWKGTGRNRGRATRWGAGARASVPDDSHRRSRF